MNPANSEEFTIGYYLSKDLGVFDVDFGFRLDQIEECSEEEHGDDHDDDHGDDHGDEHGEDRLLQYR